MDGFRARLNAVEGHYAREANASATRKHLEKLIEAGKLQSASSLIPTTETHRSQLSTSASHVPTVFRERHHADKVYQHTNTNIPVPRAALIDSWAQLGTRVSFGRARWTIDDANIFSVADGKRMAQEPVKLPAVYDRNRIARVQQAALESPLVQGYRLLPQFTPGRALLWGTILAVWGSGAVVMSTARALGIHTVEEAGDRLRAVLAPCGNAINSGMVPLKDWLAVEQLRDSTVPSVLPQLARQLKSKLAGP